MAPGMVSQHSPSPRMILYDTIAACLMPFTLLLIEDISKMAESGQVLDYLVVPL
jgi:hypothetical protein